MTADRIAFVDDAVTDLEGLAEYIDARNPAAAVKLRDAIRAAVALLADTDPRLDTRFVTLRSGVVCQRHYVRPAVIFYRREPGVLTVLRVFHHAREPVTR